MRRILLLSVTVLSLGTGALANHPGERLNAVTAEKEAGFEAVSRPGPELNLVSEDGEVIDLETFAGRILVLAMRPAACGERCDAQQAKLEKTMTALNASPMRDMVSFLTVTETPEGTYAPEAENWAIARPKYDLAPLQNQLAAASTRPDERPMLHLFDRQGQHVAIFHGTDFKPLNLLMHINGLTNAHPHPEPEGFLAKLRGWFE